MTEEEKQRIADHARNHCHFVKSVDIEILEGIFAVFTPQGWSIPEWLILLRVTCQYE